MRELKDKTTKELEQLKQESIEAMARIRAHIATQDYRIATDGIISDPVKVHGRSHAFQCHLRRSRDIGKILLERKKAEKKIKPGKIVYAPSMKWGQREFQNVMKEARL